MAKVNNQRKVNRTLYCFKLSITIEPNIHIFTWRDMFEHFKAIDERNLIAQDDDSSLLLVIDEITDQYVKGHFNRLRYDNPRVIDIVAKTDLIINLKPEQNLIERAHFIYYPNSNILVAEYNHYGTRAFGKFGEYVMECIPQIQKCNLLPYIQKDSVEEAGKKKGKFRKYELTIAPPALPIIEEAFGLGITEVLRSKDNEEIDANLTIKIQMSAGKRPLPSVTQNKVMTFIEQFRIFENRTGIKTAKITADKIVDLFGGEYFHKVSVLSIEENSRVVISIDMYNELDRFYNNHVLKELTDLKTRG